LLTAIPRYVVVHVCCDISISIILHPKRPLITRITGLFLEFSLGAIKRILIWSIKRSTRQREKEISSWLFLFLDDNISIGEDTNTERCIKKTKSLKTTH
jgi:hypothetical protein